MKKPEINEEEKLQNVTGGASRIHSQMKCSSCGYFVVMPGDHSGNKYDCPSCGKKNSIVCIKVDKEEDRL